MSTVFKSVDTLQPEDILPSTVGREGDFLRVKPDATGAIEWYDTAAGPVDIDTLRLGVGDVNVPSLTFQSDTSCGIWLEGAGDMRFTTANVQRLALNGNSIDVGTDTSKLLMNMKGSINYSSTTIPPGTYDWNDTFNTDGVYVLQTSSGDININLNSTGGTSNIGRTVRFVKNSTGFTVKFFSAGSVTRLSGAFGTQSRPAGQQFTHIPDGTNNTWMFEIIRDGATYYTLNIISYHNFSNQAITYGDVFMAGDGSNSAAAYAFKNVQGLDTGMYYAFDSIDRLRFTAGGQFLQEMNAGQCFYNVRLLVNNSAQTPTVPAVIFHNDSSTTGYSGERTNPSTDPRLYGIVNGVTSTELTRTAFNIGQNTLNSTNMKTLNQYGPSVFHTYTPTYTPIVQTQTAATGYTGTVNLRSISYNGTHYVITNGTNTAGQVRVAVTTDFATFTQFTNTVIATGNNNASAFGNGYFVVLSTTSGTQNYYFTTSANVTTTWTRVDNAAPWSGTAQVNFIRYLNGQFICGTNNGLVRVCTDPSAAANWTEVDITPAQTDGLFDISYSPEIRTYVVVSSTARVWYWVDSSNTGITAGTSFTSVSVHRSKGITWSPRLGMFLMQDDTTGGTPLNTNRFSYSKTGSTWTTYISAVQNFSGAASPQGLSWNPDLNAFMCVQSLSGNNQYAFSRDGINWSFTQNNLTMTASASFYDTTSKRLVLIASAGTTAITFKNLTADIAALLDVDGVYNTFNSNVRMNDVIEYQTQFIATSPNDNHFTVSAFTRSTVSFDTTAGNANIYLQQYPGRVGARFRIEKFTSSDHNVRIHGYESVRLLLPGGGVITSFSASSTPQVYNIIPADNFGTFTLSKVSDSPHTWMVDNVSVYTTSGTQTLGNTLVLGTLGISSTSTCNFDAPIRVSGAFHASKESIGDITATFGLDVNASNFLTYYKYNYIDTASTNFYIHLENLNNAAFDGSCLWFCGAENNTATTFYIESQMGANNLVKVYKNGSITTLTDTQVTTIDKDQWVMCVYKHSYRGGNNYWLVHHFNSSA